MSSAKAAQTEEQEEIVQRLCNLGLDRPRDQVLAALIQAKGNPDRAVELLL